MGNKLKAISKVFVALALLGAAVPTVEAAPTVMAAKKATKKAKKSTKKVAKKSTKKAKKAKKTTKKVAKKAAAKKPAKKSVKKAVKKPVAKKPVKNVAKKTATKKPVKNVAKKTAAKKTAKKSTKKSVKKAVKKPVAKKPVKNVAKKTAAKKTAKKSTKKSVKKVAKKPVAKNPAKDANIIYKDTYARIIFKKKAVEQVLADAQNDLSQKQAALDSAKQAYKGAVAAYNNKIAAAKASYDEASRAYEAAGYDFIMSKATPNYYQDSKTAIANDAYLASLGDVTELDDYVKSVLKTSNLKNDVKLIKELNSLRATDNNFSNHNALGVDYDLMIFASFSNVIGGDHTYDDAMGDPHAENLAFGYSDPLDGWYTEEKAIYDAHESGETGHYINCMGNFQYVGLVFDQSTETSAADFVRSSQLGTQVSVDEFEAALNSYVASYEPALNAAKRAYDQAQADNKSPVDAAKENVNSSQAAYDEAAAKVEKFKRVNQQLSKTKAYQVYQKFLKSSHKKK
ncbi:hypothetical protein VST03_04815 [Lactobacillus delbrueckii subsp. allosunkii]|uniref:hypothetical protein n=1 Tax=Lactobacillus delbrueckii TaxID=1584 RepID=UPI003A881F68